MVAYPDISEVHRGRRLPQGAVWEASGGVVAATDARLASQRFSGGVVARFADLARFADPARFAYLIGPPPRTTVSADNMRCAHAMVHNVLAKFGAEGGLGPALPGARPGYSRRDV